MICSIIATAHIRETEGEVVEVRLIGSCCLVDHRTSIHKVIASGVGHTQLKLSPNISHPLELAFGAPPLDPADQVHRKEIAQRVDKALWHGMTNFDQVL